MRAAAGALAAFLLIAAAAPDASPMSPTAFRDRLAAVAAQRGRATNAVDDRTFTARTKDGTETTVSIDNAYAQYLTQPEQLESIISRYAAVLGVTDQVRDETIDQLVVIVRPADYLQRSLPPGASLANFIPARPMASDLAYFLAVDAATTIRTVQRSDLARWKIDEAGAWLRATANIKARVGTLTIVRLGDEAGASGMGVQSGLAPSILADPALCGVAVPDPSRIVLLYQRDMFLFTEPSDPVMTRRFWQVARAEIAGARSLSATPLTCRNGRWIVATER